MTGGAGFIGSHTVDELLRLGHHVTVLDSLEAPVHIARTPPSYLNTRADLRIGDVCDEAALLKSLSSCDAVYHFAAFQDYLPTFSRYIHVNVVSTALIFELIVREKLPIKKVIVAGSQAAAGEGLYRDALGRTLSPDIRPRAQLELGQWEVAPPVGYKGPMISLETDESTSNPQNQYGLSKLAEENVAIQLGRRYEIPTVCLRYSIVQGPRQSIYNAYSGACRIFSLSFREGRLPTIFEDGHQLRDFVNIQDVVEANCIALLDARSDYQVLNVGGGRAYTVSEFAKIVADAYGFSQYEPVASGKYRFGDTRHIVSDISRMEALGWKPNRNVEESVASYKAWLSDLNPGPSGLENAEREMEALGVVRRLLQ